MNYKIISENRKAYYIYEILETYEAGIVLTGKEIKAIRAGKVNLTGSYAKILLNAECRMMNDECKSELFLLGMHISVKDGDVARTRKLLMHRREIDRLIGKTQQKNLTLVPLRIYLKRGRAKIALGLARGKKLHDKREIIKKRDLDREARKIG